jgi:transcriptional regulator with XRE-family HTH domain
MEPRTTREESGDGMQITLPVRLRSLRAARGWTVEHAAEEIGLTPDNLSRIERGVRHPRATTLARIARGYGVGIEELMSLEEESYRPLASQPRRGRTRHRGADLPRSLRKNYAA